MAETDDEARGVGGDSRGIRALNRGTGGRLRRKGARGEESPTDAMLRKQEAKLRKNFRRNLPLIRNIGKYGKLGPADYRRKVPPVGVLDPYSVLETERQTEHERNDSRHEYLGAIGSWLSGESDVINRKYDALRKELEAAGVPERWDQKKWLDWAVRVKREDMDTHRRVIAKLKGDLVNARTQLETLKNTDGRTESEIAGGEPPHLPFAQIRMTEETIKRLIGLIKLEESLFYADARDLAKLQGLSRK